MAGVQEAIEDNSGALNKIAEASEIVSTGLEFVGVVAEIGSHIPVIGELCDTIKSLLELLGSFSVVLNEVFDVGKRAGETAELMSEVVPIVKKLPEEKQRRTAWRWHRFRNRRRWWRWWRECARDIGGAAALAAV